MDTLRVFRLPPLIECSEKMDPMLSEISQRMYDGYGVSDASGISYFQRFYGELERIPFSQVFEFQLKRYPSQFVTEFVLCSHELWKTEPVATWTGVLTRPEGRPDPSGAIDDIGAYADIEFLVRFVRVDAVAFLLQSPHVQTSEKRKVRAYFLQFFPRLVPSDLDLEDMDGSYFASIEEIGQLKARLCAGNVFNPLPADENEARDFLLRHFTSPMEAPS